MNKINTDNNPITKRIKQSLAKNENCIKTKIIKLGHENTLMIEYLGEKGIEISDKLLACASEITFAIDTILCKDDDKENVQKGRGNNETEITQELYLKALSVHNKLSKLAYPANAVTINYTRQTFGLLFKNNKVITLLSFLLLLL